MYSCVHGCGYQSGHRGGMNLHETIHCKKKQEGSAAQMKNDRACTHTWRFLNQSELRLLASRGADDYEEVCSKCHDLK